MSKHILEILFDSKTKLKILKFLFRNSASSFNIKELSTHIQEKPITVKKELDKLAEIGLIKIKKWVTLKEKK